MDQQDPIRAFIDGDLDAQAVAGLEASLRDPDQARRFLRELHFERSLRSAAHSQERRAELAVNPRPPATGRLRARRAPRWRRIGSGWDLARSGAVALMLLLPAALVLSTALARPPAARLAVHLGTASVEGQARGGASDLAAGELLTVSERGWASLRLLDGTLIEVAGGTRLRLDQGPAGLRVDVLDGEVRADVRPQPADQPLVFAGARSRATVLGTRLTFATALGGDRLAVLSGLVRCTSSADGRSIDVPAGHQVAVDGGTLALKPLPPPAEPIPEPPAGGLVAWFDAQQGVVADALDRVDRWRDRRGNGLELTPPALVERPLLVREPRPALRFAAFDQVLGGPVPFPTTGAFSVAFALKANRMGRWSQGLGWGWGSFSFHAQADGAVFAGVGAPGGGIRFEPGGSAEDIPGGTLVAGRWQRVVITYGSGVGAFHLDGRLLARKAMPAPQPRPMLSIGRHNGPPEEPFGFAGELSELLVYDRVLEAHEVQLIDRRLRRGAAP